MEARVILDNVVTMNSKVGLTDLNLTKTRTVTLVYPDDVDLAVDSTSILEPLGTALLGCALGDVIECPTGKCPQRFRIDAVVYQPERVGAFYL